MSRERVSFTELTDVSQKYWPEASVGVSLIAPAIYRLHEYLNRLARELFKQYNLQSAEFETLCALRNSPEPYRITPTELYRKLLVSSGGMTKILLRLEDKELIERPANLADARSRLVALTPKGKSLIEKVTAQLIEQEAELVARIDQPGQLEQHLLRWLAQIESHQDDKGPHL
ncbi:MarR family winged helix-turn-helix transcriptional regulator [Marinobacterium sediminicola]|uniref:DNA-binding transcriptional regulator, MarR family n=1 Tax=Marinobacterium sediminicola TaxID=518898 RepID=A0ABY1S181_9GAMM|nr:MarR family transcriptional regulator [Marinobacterium sediminicola]ULG69830.1 MarR family transcriptional regulator [Marinobacterium sediminicola]SMR75356.1 DNA-binding transcriptional regulator, MarR family [Marinobacterium sediminicola]